MLQPIKPLSSACRSCPRGRLSALLAAGLLCGVGADAVSARPPAPLTPTVRQAQEQPEETPEERRERMRALAEERRAQRLAEREAQAAEAVAAYEAVAQAYLSNDTDRVQEMYKDMRLQMRLLSRDQQLAMRHMNERAPGYRPGWWDGTKRQEKNSFEAEIWGRKFWANYVPTRELGLQAVFPQTEFNQRTGKFEIVDLIILVTWKPLMVDSAEPAKGRLSVTHGYSLGDIAEFIIWHELGHNYITEQLPTRANVQLYTDYSELYSTLHEYYADMSALYHCTPRARRVVLQFRLDGLDYYTPDESHCRASHGIGAIVLADMLANPDAWPSVHFPPSVPAQQVELNTLIYVYENLGADWSIHEDMRLQELAKEYIMKQGENTFKRKGEITLPNRLKFALMISDDREHQAERDRWVTEKLEQLIINQRADTLAEGEAYEPPNRSHLRDGGRVRIVLRNGEEVDDPDAPKRIEVPWEQ